MNGLIDIGLNLAHDSFDADREAVLSRAQHAGVERFIITGTSVADSAAACELASSLPDRLFATAGVHPHHADELDAAGLEALRDLSTRPDVVAVGECGLDFFRDFAPRPAQESAFEAQLELAADVDLPVFLHQRDAHERFLALLAPRRTKLAGGVAHCFTGGTEELAAYLDLDLYIGITGWLCDERRGQALREAVPRIPLDRLLIETDAPYLLPRDLPEKPRSRRNEPCYLPHILTRIAALRSETLEQLAEATRVNSERLFRLTQRA
jgi:TatD DNase family protein